ncbi:hypothetical protein Y032_0466g1982 [Ancylostoma ceylanicum]|uniref:Uncharacterized protein n=1 Tax=Ancylostoma ceylanicum TaxID=53326 RepID=A0A016WXA3_9BILA|nr:hypothetical protein Y032_0466g1982 [Ancylostoma ceylanicum]
MLLREHRASEQLKEQVQLMNELVEKLEAEHAAEYKRRLEEISKQMANDMSASIALAHKQVSIFSSCPFSLSPQVKQKVV